MPLVSSSPLSVYAPLHPLSTRFPLCGATDLRPAASCPPLFHQTYVSKDQPREAKKSEAHTHHRRHQAIHSGAVGSPIQSAPDHVCLRQAAGSSNSNQPSSLIAQHSSLIHLFVPLGCRTMKERQRERDRCNGHVANAVHSTRAPPSMIWPHLQRPN